MVENLEACSILNEKSLSFHQSILKFSFKTASIIIGKDPLSGGQALFKGTDKLVAIGIGQFSFTFSDTRFITAFIDLTVRPGVTSLAVINPLPESTGIFLSIDMADAAFPVHHSIFEHAFVSAAS